MAELPINLTAREVRAIQAGAMTQFRRVVKLQPPRGTESVYLPFPQEPNNWQGYSSSGQGGVVWYGRCPYGQPGDRLWGREAWGYRCTSGTRTDGQYLHTVQYRADDSRQTFGPMPMDGVGLPKQRDRRNDEDYLDWDEYLTRYWQQFRPSTQMPRWASRISFDVVSRRVERVRDISEADAVAEGIRKVRDNSGCWVGREGPGAFITPWPTAREAFADLWESIHGPGAWDLNDWVWVVEFRRVS
jgi:hypothetical protein